jgi:hypothetical protein
MIFGSLKQFLEFKTIEKGFKIAAKCRAKTDPTLPRRWPTRYARFALTGVVTARGTAWWRAHRRPGSG